MTKPIVLICSPLRFYTLGDENVFFYWLSKIPSIEKYEGVGKSLHCYIACSSIAPEQLLDLIGIFNRYKFDKNQLKVFMNEGNKEWFLDE